MLLAMRKIDEDFVCMYSDILISQKTINKLILDKTISTIKLPILKYWERIWKYKGKSIYDDAEDLTFNKKNFLIKSIGSKITKKSQSINIWVSYIFQKLSFQK